MAEAWRNARSFTGEHLREIAFPLGGIGTGTVSLGGRGNLQDWEIFNRPAKGRDLPYTFFSLWARRAAGGEKPVARVLERRFLPPYVEGRRAGAFQGSGFGLATAQVSGLPRLREAAFHGAYPLAVVEFQDGALPVRVRLEAMNPLIPMNDRDSGLPLAWLTWVLENPGAEPVEATVAFSLLNACGYDGQASLGNRVHALFGRNLNEPVREGGLTGLRMSSAKVPADHPQFGTMAVATPAEHATWRTRWERAGWWDDAQSFWDGFSADGTLPDGPEPEPSPDGQTDVGTLGVRLTVPPGGQARAPFLLAWHFPNLTNTWNGEETVKGRRLGNWYAAQWPDAWAVARYAHEHARRLEQETRRFHQTLFESTLPSAVLDAASANASILRTTTVLRTEDGRLNGFEGCHDNGGCCPMNCTHVWNYEQAVAHLFPALERTVRETDFAHNTRPDGSMAFRTLLPLTGELWAMKPAADGQMGTIMKVYREWLQCGDRAFLERMWPGVQRALEFAWQPGSWDADRDGVMEGEQHNTYDIEFYGPNTMCGLFYLGALRAAEEMALALGHGAKAAEYHAVYESGRRGYADLFNGDYLEQTVVPPTPLNSGTSALDSVRYQYGAGCLADQLLGQWFSRVVGLGDLLPAEMVRAALAAVFRHNFHRDLSEHASVQRVYAVNDEAGLLMCTWPQGGRPRYPFPYADEVWTGIEYQVAAHLVYEGLVDEGLAIVRAVRDRHDGLKRNPWDEFECGHHYARAMSSWSLVLALSGYHWNAAEGLLAFDPQVSATDFRCFFSAGGAWGCFMQRQGPDSYEAAVDVQWGEMTLKALRLPLGRHAVEARVGGLPVAAEVEDGSIAFAAGAALAPGRNLVIRARIGI